MLKHELPALLRLTCKAQIRLPRSCVTLVETAPSWLVTLSRGTGAQAEAAALLVILAPRLLWPEPAKASKGKLAPWSRPRQIHSRIRLLYQGQWQTLLRRLMEAGTHRSLHSPFNTEEDQNRSEGIAVVQQAKKGRAGAAWKRVRGLGLLAAGDQASIASKQDPLHMQGTSRHAQLQGI